MKSYKYNGVEVRFYEDNHSGMIIYTCDLFTGVYTNRFNINLKIKSLTE